MIRTSLFSISLLVLFIVSAHSQTIPSRTGSGLGMQRWGTEVSVSDVNGRPFKPYEDVQGDPFFSPQPASSTLILNSGRKISNVFCRIDLYSNEIHFLNPGSEEFTAPAGLITEVKFYQQNVNDSTRILFRSNFPAIDKLDDHSFYQVLADGKINLLKSMQKKINTVKDDVSGESHKQFDLYENYYVYNGKSMLTLKRERNFFTGLMNDHQAEIDAYLKKATVNFRKNEDLVKLMTYYNSL